MIYDSHYKMFSTKPARIIVSQRKRHYINFKPYCFSNMSLQARRIAAIRLAERVQQQISLQTTPSLFSKIIPRAKVGYRIMNETQDQGCHIVYSTVGYLVAWLARNERALEKVTHVVVDEAHERSVDTVREKMNRWIVLVAHGFNICIQ